MYVKREGIICRIVSSRGAEQRDRPFVQFYDYERYHKSPNNLMLTNVYFGRAKEVLTKRDCIKRLNLPQRWLHDLHLLTV